MVAIIGIMLIVKVFREDNAHMARVANGDICPMDSLPGTPGATPSSQRHKPQIDKHGEEAIMNFQGRFPSPMTK